MEDGVNGLEDRMRAQIYSTILNGLTAIAALASTLAPLPARAQVTCTWAGTAADQQGVFYIGDLDRHGGIVTPPQEKPSVFSATGPLAGAHPRCTGTMTIHGEFLPGSTCTAIRDFGTISGVPGLSHFDGAVGDLGTGAIRATLLGPDGEVAGQYQANALSPPGEEIHSELCRTQEGTRADTEFYGTVELLP